MAWRRGKGEFQSQTYGELYGRACALAAALIELGLEARQQVALISDNRSEWLLCDCAILLCGAADVPRAADVTESEISYIVAHSDSTILMAENLAVLQRVLAVRATFPQVGHIILMEGEPPSDSGVLKLADLMERGKYLRSLGDKVVEERLGQIQGDDIFTVIYTSGTTGTPKGVMLTHDNMISQVRYLPFALTPEDRVLSILPIWHSYERVFEMVTVSRGACTYYTTPRRVGEDLRTVRPTWMASAPRLWEGLYNRILSNVRAAPPLRRALFHAAYHCSREYQRSRFFLTGQLIDLVGRSPGQSLILATGHLMRLAIYAIPTWLLDRLVLHKLRLVVGGAFQGTVSGGGALPPHVDEFFNYIGIPVLEGYGMTETSPVLAVRTWRRRILGTVGPFWPQTEIRIVEPETGKIIYPDKSQRGGGRGIKGEIHAKGPQIMKGYYKNEEATQRVLRQGWMNTGDLGMVTFNECLKILGRSKETIVLMNGENVEPVPIESKLLQSRLVEHCIVVGQDEKCLGALIVPCLEALKGEGLEMPDHEAAAQDERVLRLISAEARNLVSKEQGFKPFETLQGIRLIGKPFEVGDELTATFKLRRHIITDKYGSIIKEIYPRPGEPRRT